MRKETQILARLGLAAFLATAGRAGAAPPGPNLIRDVAVADRGGAVEVEVRGTTAPSYTVFKLQDPSRLVLDLAGADVSGVSSPIRVDRGGVGAVTTAQFQDDRSGVGRVVIGLDAGARYEVAPRGDAVVVKVTPSAAARAGAPAPVAVAPLPPPPAAT